MAEKETIQKIIDDLNHHRLDPDDFTLNIVANDASANQRFIGFDELSRMFNEYFFKTNTVTTITSITAVKSFKYQMFGTFTGDYADHVPQAGYITFFFVGDRIDFIDSAFL